ncbi:amino acid ABC transporter substrate-binding protein [Undibacterium flavidum]|uniref:Amino acid ABC transporter substrate-binding protein n=1 Tax=Undibacterium flavidum TaxID=2762297 RepID=A0ABR6YBH9_9BURK|nr:amino acid ABC transporter substrate-binding protein [Undibacterium flavidum]MBC3873987.1 amino acid ABC transporter substrate-binding protein [Undibacterium flavidum]
MFKLLSYALILLFTAEVTAEANAADTLARIKERKTIVIAHRAASIPISYLSEDSKPIGYAMDICSKVVERIKRELKLPQLAVSYLLVNPSNRFIALQEEKADMECGTTANTAERRKQVAFTIPYFFSATRILTKVESSIKNWSDLTQKRVVILRGSSTANLLRQQTRLSDTSVNLIEASTSSAAFETLLAGKADAVVMEEVNLAGLRAIVTQPEKWKIVGDGIGIEAQSIVFAKDDSALKALVDKEIARMINEGELSKLYEKWFMQPLPTSGLNYGLPMNFLLRDSLRFPSDKVFN